MSLTHKSIVDWIVTGCGKISISEGENIQDKISLLDIPLEPRDHDIEAIQAVACGVFNVKNITPNLLLDAIKQKLLSLNTSPAQQLTAKKYFLIFLKSMINQDIQLEDVGEVIFNAETGQRGYLDFDERGKEKFVLGTNLPMLKNKQFKQKLSEIINILEEQDYEKILQQHINSFKTFLSNQKNKETLKSITNTLPESLPNSDLSQKLDDYKAGKLNLEEYGSLVQRLNQSFLYYSAYSNLSTKVSDLNNIYFEKSGYKENASIAQVVKDTNHLYFMIAGDILEEPVLEKRVKICKLYADIAEQAMQQGDINTVAIIHSAFNQGPIFNSSLTRSLFRELYHFDFVNKFNDIFSSDNNYKNLRQLLLSNHSLTAPLSLTQGDMIKIISGNENNPTSMIRLAGECQQSFVSNQQNLMHHFEKIQNDNINNLSFIESYFHKPVLNENQLYALKDKNEPRGGPILTSDNIDAVLLSIANDIKNNPKNLHKITYGIFVYSKLLSNEDPKKLSSTQEILLLSWLEQYHILLDQRLKDIKDPKQSLDIIDFLIDDKFLNNFSSSKDQHTFSILQTMPNEIYQSIQRSFQLLSNKRKLLKNLSRTAIHTINTENQHNEVLNNISFENIDSAMQKLQELDISSLRETELVQLSSTINALCYFWQKNPKKFKSKQKEQLSYLLEAYNKIAMNALTNISTPKAIQNYFENLLNQNHIRNLMHNKERKNAKKASQTNHILDQFLEIQQNYYFAKNVILPILTSSQGESVFSSTHERNDDKTRKRETVFEPNFNHKENHSSFASQNKARDTIFENDFNQKEINDIKEPKRQTVFEPDFEQFDQITVEQNNEFLNNIENNPRYTVFEPDLNDHESIYHSNKDHICLDPPFKNELEEKMNSVAHAYQDNQYDDSLSNNKSLEYTKNSIKQEKKKSKYLEVILDPLSHQYIRHTNKFYQFYVNLKDKYKSSATWLVTQYIENKKTFSFSLKNKNTSQSIDIYHSPEKTTISTNTQAHGLLEENFLQTYINTTCQLGALCKSEDQNTLTIAHIDCDNVEIALHAFQQILEKNQGLDPLEQMQPVLKDHTLLKIKNDPKLLPIYQALEAKSIKLFSKFN